MGIMQRAMLLWMMDAAERNAVLLHESISGLGMKDMARAWHKRHSLDWNCLHTYSLAVIHYQTSLL
jgi:hypothetical protein